MKNPNYVPAPLRETSDFTTEDARFMQTAIDLSVENVKNGGGPFGAVIVKDGKIIATGVNRVTANCDPTAHAEVSAIRNACEKLKTFKLEGCTIYSSCEPCPMCLSAIYWAGISGVCYGNTKDDASTVGFDDSFIYEQLAMDYSHRSIAMRHFMRAKALKAFKEWHEKTDRIDY
jgi:hypothetical protein